MKHETLMLSGLFAACLLVCTLVLGSMLSTSPAPSQTAASRTLAVSTSLCAVPGGVRCPLPRG
ncbi:hypothetical protein [Rhodanobacter aciditrophus]|uniref:hypothetical protein n=1 Tax=Rhodanobacter aciditrophus TaxID=1623218 RepID=UPI003CF67057